MIVDIDNPSRATVLRTDEWSAAEFLDANFSAALKLRALVCCMGGGQWQWTVLSLNGQRGELISIGTEKSAAAARSTAATEIAKCLENPIEVAGETV